MKVGILGSGFGLYGYLPAVYENGYKDVFLPVRYRQKLSERADVHHLAESINWVDSEGDLTQICDALIIAKRPIDQVEIVSTALKNGTTKLFLLEKPIARTPQQAVKLLQDLKQADCVVQSGLYFDKTSWAKKIHSFLQNGPADNTIRITWNFKAHHYAHNLDNWKRNVSEGGGVLRFFGIHFVSMMAANNFVIVQYSNIECKYENSAEEWSARFANARGDTIEISIDSNCKHESFVMDFGNGQTISNRTPFDDFEKVRGYDLRVKSLQQKIKKLLTSRESELAQLDAATELWKKIEAYPK